MTEKPLTTVDAMLHAPKVCGPQTSAADLRRLFADDHVHAALVVDDGRLMTVIERADIAAVPVDRPARELGRLEGRTVRAQADLESTRQRMCAKQIRRLAVVDDHDVLLGLLCLKNTGLGFCSDHDVAARAAEKLSRWADLLRA